MGEASYDGEAFITGLRVRDAPVLASFNQPRQLKTTQRTSNEEIIKLDNPL